MSNNSSGNERIFLNCPFKEKDEVKKQGARWDANERKWFIPPNLYDNIERFNKWKPKGRIYLNCPFSDKNKAKNAGARWDGPVRKWYYIAGKVGNEDIFKQWLPDSSSSTSSTPTVPSTPQKKLKKKVAEKPKAKAKVESSSALQKKKNNTSTESNNEPTPTKRASVATLPRINKDMTITQLQDECRSRDPSIKGLSSKNKQWLLDHLGIGTVWTIGSQSRLPRTNAKKDTPKKTAKSSTKPQITEKKRKLEEVMAKQNGKETIKKKPKKQTKKSVVKDIKSLPRITPSLTVAQLSHELHYRDPSITGTSNKNKQWFLDHLGLGSVWMASTEAKECELQDIPRLSSSLTVAQLSHELLERVPNQTGMSGKKKDWYFEQLCLGSLWITGPRTDELNKVKPKNKKAVAKKTTTTVAKGILKGTTDNSTVNKTVTKKDVVSSQAKKTKVGGKMNKAKVIKQKIEKIDKPDTPRSSTYKAQSPANVSVKIKTKAAIPNNVKSLKTPIKLREEKVKLSSDSVIKSETKSPKPEEVSSSNMERSKLETDMEIIDITEEESPSNTNRSNFKTEKEIIFIPEEVSSSNVKRSVVGSIRTKKEIIIKSEEVSTNNTTISKIKTDKEIIDITEEDSPSNTHRSKIKTEKKMIFIPEEVSSGIAKKSEVRSIKTEKEIIVKLEEVSTTNTTRSIVKTEENSSTNNKRSEVRLIKADEKIDGIGKEVSSSNTKGSKLGLKKIKEEEKINGHVKVSSNDNKTRLNFKSTPNKVEKKIDDKGMHIIKTKSSSSIPQIPTVSSSMTVAQLKEECKVRDSKIKGLSGKNKAWVLNYLLEGSELEGSAEWQARANKWSKQQHKYVSLCHLHPLADSGSIRATVQYIHGTRSCLRRADSAICDMDSNFFCEKRPYRTCEKCDFDICQVCFEIESLPEPQKKKLLAEKYELLNKQRKEEERIYKERMRKFEREERLREERYERQRQERIAEIKERYRDDLARFPSHVQNPSGKFKNSDKKLKYFVWTSHDGYNGSYRQFNSSYDTLEDANLRVEYIFYYDNPNEIEKDEMYTTCDDIDATTGRRYMKDEDQNFSTGAALTCAFEYINVFCQEVVRNTTKYDGEVIESKNQYPRKIHTPTTRHTNSSKKLKYTVWTSESCEGFPSVEFNSSYATIDEANKRAAYVFYFKNPWGFEIEEMHADYNEVYKEHGTRFLQVQPDDCSEWTVSVVLSEAYGYIYDEPDSSMATGGFFW